MGTTVKTTAEIAKDMGFQSLREVAELSATSTQNLNNWRANKPELFEVILLGCLEKKRRLTEQSD